MSKKSKFELSKTAIITKYVIEIILAVLTLSAFIVTYLTLKEIKIQRFKAYEPELRLSSTDFNQICKIRNVNESDSMTFWFDLVTYNTKLDSSIFTYPISIKTGKKINDWTVFPAFGNLFYLPLNNIGQGVALEVNISYSFDTVAFLNLFNTYSDLFLNIDSIYYDYSQKGFILQCKDYTRLIKDFQETKEIQFVQANYLDRIEHKLFLPENYFKLVSLWYLFIEENRELILFEEGGHKELFEKYFIPPHHPPLNITMEYKDINKGSYTRSFICQFEPPKTMFSIFTGRTFHLHGKMNVKYVE